MVSKTKGGALDLHHGGQTHIDLWFHSLVGEGQKNVSRSQLSKLQKSPYLTATGAIKLTPLAAVEVLLELPPLCVITEAEAQARVYRLWCTQQWRPKSTNFGHTKKISGYEARTQPTDGVSQDTSEICLPQAIHGQLP